jgi:hypothetical protein
MQRYHVLELVPLNMFQEPLEYGRDGLKTMHCPSRAHFAGKMEGHCTDIGTHVETNHSGLNVVLDKNAQVAFISAKGNNAAVDVIVRVEAVFSTIPIAIPSVLGTLWLGVTIGFVS